MTAISSARATESTDSYLRLALRADAILSGVCGVAIAAAAAPLSGYTGIPKSVDYAIGVGFILYGLVVFGLAARPRVRGAGIGVAIANAVGTVAAVAVVLADVLPLSTAGVVLTLATGVYTAVMADLQYLGVRRIRA
jgi:hypothetical protein